MVKKIKLAYTQNYDFLLIGISSDEREHKFIWGLNQLLLVQFSKTENHRAFHKKLAEEQEFSAFSFTDEDTLIEYRIISNKSETGILMDELRNIDYFLIVNGEFDESFAEDLQNKLRAAASIQAVFRIDPNTLKSRERLLN